MTQTIPHQYLELVNLQMASEAFLGDIDSVDKYKAALTTGNGHNSVFTEKQANEFVKHYKVVAHRR